MDDVRKRQLAQYNRTYCQVQIRLTLPQVWALQTAAERLGIGMHDWIHGRLLAELPEDYYERPPIEHVVIDITEFDK